MSQVAGRVGAGPSSGVNRTYAQTGHQLRILTVADIKQRDKCWSKKHYLAPKVGGVRRSPHGGFLVFDFPCSASFALGGDHHDRMGTSWNGIRQLQLRLFPSLPVQRPSDTRKLPGYRILQCREGALRRSEARWPEHGLRRLLAVVDDCTRECLTLVADTSLSGVRVARELDRLITERGRPGTIISNNGTELTSNAILTWADERHVGWHYIAPGKPIQNAFSRKLQRQAMSS